MIRARTVRRVFLIGLGVALVILVLWATSTAPLDPKTPSASASSAQVLDVVEEMNAFYTEQAEEHGLVFEVLASKRVYPGQARAVCDGYTEPAPEFEDVTDNAFVQAGCQEGPYLIFDPGLRDDPLDFRAVMAHEWAHVLQAADPDEDPIEWGARPIDAELQADCFTGVWAEQNLDEAQYERVRASMLTLGDEPDVPASDEEAHGTGEERQAAFDHGAEAGTGGCLREVFEPTLPTRE